MKTINTGRLIVLALLGFFLQQTVLVAQPHHKHERKVLSVQQYQQELELTDSQLQQLKALEAATKAKIETLQQAEPAEPVAQRAAKRTILDEHRAAMQQLLTEEQLTELRELRRANRANHRADQQELRVDFQAFNAELKTRYQQEYLPVLLMQRAKLEAKLSTADKTQIAILRESVQASKKEHEARRQAWKSEKHDHQDKAIRPGRKRAPDAAQKEKHAATKAQVKALVDKYEADINDLFVEIEPQTEAWKQEIEQVKEKYQLDDSPRKRHHGKKHRMLPRKGHFLLMDPDAVATDPIKLVAPSIIDGLTTYPNPAQNSTTIRFSLVAETTIRVDLQNENGQVVRTFPSQRYAAGPQEITLDLHALRAGVYVLTLEDAKGQVQTSRLVIE